MLDRANGGFGARLREARERRGVSLRQIANATKISIAALEALERDDISRLPGGIFSRAFVRSYAVEVGLDPEATIQDFIASFPNDSVTAGHPTSDQVEDHEAVESDRRTAGTFLWLALVSVPLAGVVIYFATSGRPIAQQPAQQAPEPASAAPAKPVEEPRPADVPTPAPVTPAPTASQPGSVDTVSPAPTPPVAPAAPAAPPAPADSPETPSDHFSVELSATRPCWVSATVDGRKQIERLLQAGDKTTVDVRQEMVLTAGDASALTVTLNGAEAKPLGKAGEVVTRRFNLSNFRSYLQPR